MQGVSWEAEMKNKDFFLTALEERTQHVTIDTQFYFNFIPL